MPEKRKSKGDKPAGQYFRAGAGAIILNQKGLVLALERADVAGAWQLPQGGMKASEEPVETAFREAQEETGISGKQLKLLGAYPEPLAYELPPEKRKAKTGRGQVQYWFLFEFSGTDDMIEIDKGKEFRSWKWIPFSDLMNTIVEFRRPIYKALAEHFHSHLAAPRPRRK